jgi:hypothetical protein
MVALSRLLIMGAHVIGNVTFHTAQIARFGSGCGRCHHGRKSGQRDERIMRSQCSRSIFKATAPMFIRKLQINFGG